MFVKVQRKLISIQSVFHRVKHQVDGQRAAISIQINLRAFYSLTNMTLPKEQDSFLLGNYKINERVTAQSFVLLCNSYEKDSRTESARLSLGSKGTLQPRIENVPTCQGEYMNSLKGGSCKSTLLVCLCSSKQLKRLRTDC